MCLRMVVTGALSMELHGAGAAKLTPSVCLHYSPLIMASCISHHACKQQSAVLALPAVRIEPPVIKSICFASLTMQHSHHYSHAPFASAALLKATPHLPWNWCSHKCCLHG